MRNQIVILAAGKGTRMGETKTPKVLIMLKNKPLILYLLEEIEKISQFVRPVIVVGYMHDKVKAILGEDYIYALQEPQLGTAHAVLSAKHKIRAENILVLYGDMPFIKADSLKKLMRLHHDKEANISLFTTRAPSFDGEFVSLRHYGRVIRNDANRIIKITEYKDATDSERGLTELNPGIYMFNAKWLWDNIEKIKNENAQKEYYLTDIVEIAIEQKEFLYSLEINPKEVLGINSTEDLTIAEKVVI